MKLTETKLSKRLIRTSVLVLAFSLAGIAFNFVIPSAISAAPGNPTCQLIESATGTTGDGCEESDPVGTSPGTTGGICDILTAPTTTDGDTTEECADINAAAKEDQSGDGEQQCGDDNSSLNWIICPVLTVVQKGANTLNSIITGLLEVDTNPIFADSCPDSEQSCQAYRKVWSTMRNLALIFIIIAGLIMVIAQAMGSQAISSYTIKSTLPRILIAAIGISLSWILLEFMVEVSNALGEGVRTLIYGPFKDFPKAHSFLGGVEIITLLVAALIFAVNSGVILFLIASLALGLLVGLLVIVFRQILLIFLIIFAPLAIAMYALPNTKKTFNTWWDWFLRCLLMFPIITGFIAIGRVVSLVAAVQAEHAPFTEKLILNILAIVGYIIPFFLLPFTFKMAGGLMGSIAQGIHGAAAKPRAGLKKSAGAEAGKTWGNFKTGNRFNPNSRATKMLGGNVVNRAGRHVGVGAHGRFGFGETGRTAMGSLLDTNAQDYARQDKNFAASMNDEDTMLAHALGNDRQALMDSDWMKKYDEGEKREKAADRAIAASKSIKMSQSSKIAAGDAVMRSGKGIGAGSGDTHDSRGRSTGDLAKVLDSVSGGNSSYRAAKKGDFQYTARQVGRNDVGRDGLHTSLKEVGLGEAGRMKPGGAKGMYGDPDKLMRALEHPEMSTGERERAIRTGYVASSSPYVSPEVGASIGENIDNVARNLGYSEQQIAGFRGAAGGDGHHEHETMAGGGGTGGGEEQ